MKKVNLFIITLITLMLLTTSYVKARSIVGPAPYFPKFVFVESTLPKGISITEVFGNNESYYQVNNNTDKPLYFFLKSSYSKEDVSKNLSKISDKLPACSSETETKTEIGCLSLMDGSNLSGRNRITPFGDGRVIFDNEEEALKSRLERVDYPNTPKQISISIYGLYDNKLVHIKGTINYEANKDYLKNTPQKKATFISKIIRWLGVLF